MARRPTPGVAAAVAVGALLLAGAVAAGSCSGGGETRRPSVARAAVAPRSDRPAVATGERALEAGVAAATLMARLFPLDAASARAVADDVASAAYRPALGAAVDAELVPLQRQVAGLAGRPIYRQSVLAARLVTFAPPRARVSAWVLLVAGQADVDAVAAATFATVTVDLVVERGGWRLDGTSETPGPSPEVRDAPTGTDAFESRLAGFADWRPAR